MLPITRARGKYQGRNAGTKYNGFAWAVATDQSNSPDMYTQTQKSLAEIDRVLADPNAGDNIKEYLASDRGRNYIRSQLRRSQTVEMLADRWIEAHPGFENVHHQHGHTHEEEPLEDEEPVDPRAGHIPGAINLPFGANIGEDGRFLSPDDLRARFEGAGITDASETVFYCGSGVSACNNLLAFEHAGLGRAKLFPGSWSQWAHDVDRPVSQG